MRYTGYRDRPQEQRQVHFQHYCREGHTEIAFVASGTNLQLVFNANQGPYTQERECDFDKEHGKVNVCFYTKKKFLFSENVFQRTQNFCLFVLK